MTSALYWWRAGIANDTNPDGADTLENEYCPPPVDEYYHHGEFDYHMLNATNLRTIIGNDLPDPDTNSDGLASLHEVYYWVWLTDDHNFDVVQYSDPGNIRNTTFLNIPPYKPTGLTAERIDNHVKLIWNTNDEFDLSHYDIFKMTYDDSLQQYSDWYNLARTTDTTYIDSDFVPTYQGSDSAFYKIAAVDSADQHSEYSDRVTVPGYIRPLSEGLTGIISFLGEFVLGDNYPNPFNPSTTISFTLQEEAFIELTVYDIRGCKVASLIKAQKPPGSYNVTFEGKNLSSGVYFYSLKMGDEVYTKKMVLTR